MSNVYYVGSGELTFDLIERIINENLKLELAPEAKLRIQKCRDYLDKKIAESEEPLYGITTGFGSLCSKSWAPCRKISSRAMLAVWARRYARSSSN